MTCITCEYLKCLLHNGLPQCGYADHHPNTPQGEYLSGKVFPTWFGCNQWRERVV